MRSATSRKPVRTVAMAPPRKAAPKKDVPMTPSHITARDGAGPHPLDSGGAGWDAVELYDLTGLTWSFTSPSSTEGRNIVKAACKRGGMALKGYSDWRKEDWAKMAAKAGVKFLDTFSTVAGMRGFRVCWAQHGVALMYVPGIRRFYTLADIAAGVADEKAERDAPEVVKVMENVGRVKKEFAEQFAIASDPALAAQAAVKANAPPAPPGSGDASPGAVGGADTAVQNNYAYPNPKSCVAKVVRRKGGRRRVALRRVRRWIRLSRTGGCGQQVTRERPRGRIRDTLTIRRRHRVGQTGLARCDGKSSSFVCRLARGVDRGGTQLESVLGRGCDGPRVPRGHDLGPRTQRVLHPRIPRSRGW